MAAYLASNGNAVLIGLLMLALGLPQLALIARRGWQHYSFRLLGLTILAPLIGIIALTVGNKENAGAAFGLLGTLVGYAFGRADSQNAPRESGGSGAPPAAE